MGKKTRNISQNNSPLPHWVQITHRIWGRGAGKTKALPPQRVQRTQDFEGGGAGAVKHIGYLDAKGTL